MAETEVTLQFSSIKDITDYALKMTDTGEAAEFIRGEAAKLPVTLSEDALYRLIEVVTGEIEKNKPEYLYNKCLEEMKSLVPAENEDEKTEQVKKFITCSDLTKLNDDESLEIILKCCTHFKLKSAWINIFVKLYRRLKDTATKKNNIPSGAQTDERKPDEIDTDEICISDEEREAARLKAIDILKTGDPIGYIRETIEEHHVGDEKTEECICVSIAGQSCLNTDGIQTTVNGDSGSGKSHLMKIHIHLVPEKYKEVTSLSPKAAYYMELKPGTIIFSDDTTPSEEMEEVIKRATTNYQEFTKHTIVKDGKKENYTIPPRINWYLTSVDSEVSMQLLNRQLTFNTSNKPEHKTAIFEKQQEKAESGEMPVIDVTERVLICRRIYDIIKSQMFKVKIPFAKRIEIEDKSNSRVFPMFLDMIKGYTVFFHMQRETDEDGYLLATEEDFNKAKALFESQTEGIVSKLNDKEREILKFIKGHRGCMIQDIAEKTGNSYATVRNILKGRPKSKSAGEGLLEKVKGLSISDETHTTDEDENHKISKKAERFILSDKFDGWSLFEGKFITLKSEQE